MIFSVFFVTAILLSDVHKVENMYATFPSRAWPGPGTRGESNNDVVLVSTNHLIPCLVQEVYGSETNVSATKWIYFSNDVDNVDNDINDEVYKVDINFVKDEKPSFETGSSGLM